MITKQQSVATGRPVFLRHETMKGVSQFRCHILEFKEEKICSNEIWK
jgi:hypothetical protein